MRRGPKSRPHVPALLCALLLLGCEPPPPPPAGAIVLGTIDTRKNGDARWVDLQNGQEVELAPGAQGGFHIWLRYRTQGLRGRIHLSRIADRLTGDKRDRVLTTDGRITIPGDGARYEPEDPIPNFMCPTPIGISVIDQVIEMLVRADAEDGSAPSEGRVRVTARCPPEGDSQRAFCLHICSG